ncbi:MAG: hypothetical protein QMD14_00195 [Candidatus Aenigmarchaeota archaeon]|nr:hypothetical protein [Candidatus Aenigmarchaeota archaeon]
MTLPKFEYLSRLEVCIEPALKLWLKHLRYPVSRLYRKIFEGKYLNTKLPDVHDLNELKRVLGEVTCTLELLDRISYPEAVWAKKRDDCDGFAILCADRLYTLDGVEDIKLVTAITKPVKNSHTVCTFFDLHLEKYRYFDNAYLVERGFESREDIVDDMISKRRSHVLCWDVVEPQTLKQIEYHSQ